METKTLFGIVSVVVALVAFLPYTVDVLRRLTKPHAYSWLTWTLLSLIACSVQLLNDAGAGAWLMAFTTVASFFIYVLAVLYGEKHFTLSDKASLLLACVAMLSWFIIKEPIIAIVMITIADAFGGFWPTFRKCFRRPYEETASMYFLFVISFAASLAAFREFDFVNIFYPASLLCLNAALALFIVFRRRFVQA